MNLKDYCDLIARHPHLKPHENAAAQHPVSTRVIEPNSGQALVSDPPKKKRRRGGAVSCNRGIRLRVCFISCRNSRRFFDDDNFCAACKHLRDAVCDWLGIDDGNPNVDFEYAQVRSRGKESVIVRLELHES